MLLINKADMARLSAPDGEMVNVVTEVDDQVRREVKDQHAIAYDVPAGCCAGYYPECNPLIPWWHHAESGKTPAAKSIPLRVHRSAQSPPQ